VNAPPRFILLQLHLLVALLATTALIGRMISLSAPALVCWRTFLASLGGIFLVTVVMRKSVLPPPGTLLPMLGIGGVVGAHWICFFGSIQLANISICLAGMATISFFTSLTEPLLERRRVRPLEVLLGLLVVLGILLVAGFERGRLAGLAVALLGALLAAVFPVLNRRFVNREGMDARVMMTWQMAGACIVCLLALPFVGGKSAFGGLFDLQGHDWFWLLMLAWICTVFAYVAHLRLLRHLSAYSSNLAFNFEPVYGILMAALVFGEHRQVHPGFFAGMAAILFANIAHPLILRRMARR
jgi:drug/metabolite transporter (DMT)-like permease